MALGAHQMDQVLSRPGWTVPVFYSEELFKKQHPIRSNGKWRDVLHDLERTNGDHRPVGAEAVRFLGDERRGHLCGAACVRSEGRGSAVPRRARSKDAGRAGLAARLAPQARSEAVAALPAVAYP